MQSINLVHTDLKPENILMVDSEYNEEKIVNSQQLFN